MDVITYTHKIYESFLVHLYRTIIEMWPKLISATTNPVYTVKLLSFLQEFSHHLWDVTYTRKNKLRQ